MYPTLHLDSSLHRPFAGTGHKKPLADYVVWLPKATCPNDNICLPGTLISWGLPSSFHNQVLCEPNLGFRRAWMLD